MITKSFKNLLSSVGFTALNGKNNDHYKKIVIAIYWGVVCDEFEVLVV